ncbi:MAG: NAD(P)-dependent alcohol dehydrogenase [Acidobacteriota bacterium]
MKALELHDDFGLDHLRHVERPEREPGDGEVRLAMRAASLNYRDLLMVTGRYDPRQPLPLVPCSDGVGVVEAIGPGVEGLEIGDRVATLFCQGWLAGEPTRAGIRQTLGGPIDGVLSERRTLPAHGVVPVPTGLSDVEASTLPCAALTAWSALVSQGRVAAGETVLVQGTGGVSIFALQIAQAAGARVILTSSQQWKLDRLAELEPWRTIHYRDDRRWGTTAREMTGGRGVDHVLEVGGGQTMAQSLRAVRVGGHIALIGVLSGVEATLELTPILMRNVRVQGTFVGSRERFLAMCRAFEQHDIRPWVDRVFPFDEAREAFAYLAARHHIGKVCLEF